MTKKRGKTACFSLNSLRAFALLSRPNSPHIPAMAKNPEHSQKTRQTSEIESAKFEGVAARCAADWACAGGTAQSRHQSRRGRGRIDHGHARQREASLQPPPDNSWDRRSGGEAAAHRARASTRGTRDDVAKRDASLTKRDDGSSSPPPAREARGGEGSGVGVAAAFTEAAVPADRPPTPDPSPPLRGRRGAESAEQTQPASPLPLAGEGQGGGLSTSHGFDEAPQSEFAPANYGTSATIPALDPELAKQLGFTTEEEDAAALARPPRNKMEALGVAATADALDALIRDGRPEFKGEDGQVKIWAPHRPPRPEKSEGGVRFVIKSEYEPKGDQPTAIKELVEGIGRHDRTQVLLGVTGSGKTYTMAKVIEATQRPAMILAPNKTLAAQLYGEFKSFFPDNAVEYFVSLLRLLPARSLCAAHRHLYREGFLDQRADRPHAPFGDAGAAGARRRHHRRLGVLHLRYRLGRNLYRDDVCAEKGRAHRPAAIDRRSRGAAVQAHPGRFYPRHLPDQRRRHRHFPGALRRPRLARQPVRRHRGEYRGVRSAHRPQAGRA